MAENSKIEWTDHTFNPWWGCVEVPLPSGSACDNCYARQFAGRFGVKWGNDEERRQFEKEHWAAPLRWDRAAAKEGRLKTVFCASMGDIFEPRKDLDADRKRVRGLIADTPSLVWLLLTKRPAYARYWIEERSGIGPSWVGVTVESQEAFDARRVHLEAVAKVAPLFLSCEPMLSRIEFPGGWLRQNVGWLICGGESGNKARPMHLDWARSLRDQAQAAGVPFFFKQWGQHSDGLVKLASKHDAGRLLDGREWNEFPNWREVANG